MAKIVISGEIGWEVTAKDIREQFAEIDPEEELDIVLSSPGGSVFQGIEISNMIREHKGKTTLTIASLAASMGSHIAESADVVRVHDDSTFMLHNPWMFTVGDFIALEKDAKLMKSLANMTSTAYAKKSNRPKSEIQPLMNDETWLFGEEIIEAGFADELIESENPEEKDDAVAFAKLQYQECQAKMKDFEEKNHEIKQIAALLPQNITTPAGDPAKKPANPPVKPPKTEENMTLAEYLAQNPEAKAQYDKDIAAVEPVDISNFELKYILGKAPKAKEQYEKALSDARTEVETGKLSKETITSVVNTISSDAYGKSIKNAGAKVLHGEKDYSSFEDLVTQADEFNAKLKLAGIKIDQPPATPGEQILDKKTLAQAKTKAAAKELSDEIKNTTEHVK